MDHYSFLGAANSAFFDEMYNKFLNSPDSIESSWRNFFQGYRFAGEIYTKNDFEKLLPDSFKKEFSVLNLIDAYRNDAQMNGLKFDSHTEEKAVELFAANIMKAGDAFYQNPMDTPFIPTWSRVKSAIPDFLIRLEKAVNEDNMRYI